MSIAVSFSPARPGSRAKHWYVWRITAKCRRKERLNSFLRRLELNGNHKLIAYVLAKAEQKGYRVNL